MNITKEQIDDLNAVLTVNVDTADYQPKIETALKTLGKKVDMKGFRKGMVPPGLVKKLYGTQVLAEELDKIINENLGNYFKENNLQILGNPLPKDNGQPAIDINSPRDYEFVFELGLAPEFDVASYLNKNTTLTEYNIKPNAEELDKEVEKARKYFGKMTNPDDGVKGDDVIYVQWQELDANGNIKEGGVDHTSATAVDMITDKTTLGKVVGLKPEQSVDVDLFAMMDKDKKDVAKQLLGVEGHAVEHLNDIFRLTLKKINRAEPAELNQEFYDKLFGPGIVTTEEDFRKKLEEEVIKNFANEGKRRFGIDLVDDLTESIKIQLPDDFLKRWLRVSGEKPVSAEDVEEGYADFSRNLKWQLIVNKIKQQGDVKVSLDDVKEHTKGSLLQQFGHMQGFQMNDEQLDSWVNEMIANKEHVQKTFDHLTEQKLIEYIKGQLTVNEKEISIEEFKKLK